MVMIAWRLDVMGFERALPKLQFSNPIRLVIWGMDEPFEPQGAGAVLQKHQMQIAALAERGIVSSICAQVEDAQWQRAQSDVLNRCVFSTFEPGAKAPRITSLLRKMGVPAPCAVFIDRDPTMLSQACAANPGLNVALPGLVDQMLDRPQLQGQPDPSQSVLAQYQLLQCKNEAADDSEVGPITLLQNSGLEVMLDYDVERHLDQALAQIAATGPLNFTRHRMPENPQEAARELRAQLQRYGVQAGLVRARDNFGDYGFVGFFLIESHQGKRRALHFVFSNKVLNMFVEHWVYDWLNKPEIVSGQPATIACAKPDVKVDWIAGTDSTTQGNLPYRHMRARGGQELENLLWLLTLSRPQHIEEYSKFENDQICRRDHTSFLMPALEGGLTSAQQAAAQALGYGKSLFETALFDDKSGAGCLYLFSFWADADIPVYRHKATGLEVPYWLIGAQDSDLISRQDLHAEIGRSPEQQARLRLLSADFEHIGILPQHEMIRRYRMIFGALPKDASVIVILANERGPKQFSEPNAKPHLNHILSNDAVKLAAEGQNHVTVIDPAPHIHAAEDLFDLNRFGRAVYLRLYREIYQRLNGLPLKGANYG